MSSGMNTEQAKEYAKTMTYSQAVSNIKHGKGIKYRKATMIKLRELAEIIDRLDHKTESNLEIPNNCETCKHYKLTCDLFSEICKYEPKTEPTTEDCDYCKMTHKYWYEHCDTCKHKLKDKPRIYGNEHNCIMTLFGDCSYAETGCGSCEVVEKVRKALDEYETKTENCSEKTNNCEDKPQTSGVVWTEDAIKDEPKSYSTWASIDEPQTEFVRVKYHCINCAENGSYKCSKCDGEMYYKYDKDEPQPITDCK